MFVDVADPSGSFCAETPTVTRLTRTDIADGLRRLGIEEGNLLYLHSSLSSLGWVDGGAGTVVAALLDVLGPDGVLMVPTFTFSGTGLFDVRRTPSKTGTISEAVRNHPRAVRSWHPTHAPCAIGHLADWLVADHILYGPLDIGSPEDRMAKLGGWVLLLGVDHRVNSTVHVGEAYAGSIARLVRYNAFRPARSKVVTPDGETLPVTITSMPGCSAGFGVVETSMRAEGLIRYGTIGDASCQLMRGQDIIDRTVALLDDDPNALACDHANCGTCLPARAMNAGRRERLAVARCS